MNEQNQNVNNLQNTDGISPVPPSSPPTSQAQPPISQPEVPQAGNLASNQAAGLQGNQAVPQATSPTSQQTQTTPQSLPNQPLSAYFNQGGNTAGSSQKQENSVNSKENKGEEKKVKKSSSSVGAFLVFIGELVITVVLAFVVVFAIKKYVIQPFFVEGISMEPTFHDKEYLIINELTYRWDDPQRGDVIVFKYPLNEEKFYIKRIIGLPGETVKVENGEVSVCKEANESCEGLEEDYLPSETDTDNEITLELKDTEYFVLGDNRDQSSDSRYWGALEGDNIIGKVWLRAWPFDKIEVY